MPLAQQRQVLIDAGPTGLVLGLWLRRFGVDVRTSTRCRNGLVFVADAVGLTWRFIYAKGFAPPQDDRPTVKHFDAFRLDTTNHCLWRGDERISLTPKAFDLLRYLVEHADRLVTHEEILEALWPDTYVNQEVVKKYILGIRKVLGDRRDKPQFIRTFPKRGYQFVAHVADDRQPPGARTAEAATPFIDRQAARAQLDTCLNQAGLGTRQVVFVTGEAGVGKTTFVDMFVQRVSGMPQVRVARGQCVEGFGGQEPYYPVLEAVDQLVRRSDEDRIVQLLAKRAPTWLLQFPSLVKADQREALQRDAIGATRERMVREICEMFEAIAADRLLIVVLEDLHWADLATLDVVSTFARRREPAQVLLLATLRPAAGASNNALTRLRQDLGIHGLCQAITLDMFELAEVSEYLALEFGHASFAADLASLIHRHSGGNALFVSALVRDLIATGTIVQDGGVWTLTAPVQSIAPGVPASLQEMLNVHFDQLSRAEQRLLRAASVIGERFPAWMVVNDEHDLDDVERVCEHLSERRLFIRSTGMAELPNRTTSAYYEFHHALYRQAIYGRLSDVARSRLHLIAAERLESLFGPEPSALAAEIAEHFEQAHEHERAIHYLMLAAANAARRFAVRDSLDVLQHAMTLVPHLPLPRRTAHEIEILERIGDAHYVLGAMVESALAYETESALAARAGLLSARVQAQSCFARPLGLLDPDRAIAVLQDATRVSVALEDPVVQSRVALLAAATRLLYDGWSADDARVCATADRVVVEADDRKPPGFDRMFYAHVEALQGNAAAALKTAESGIPRSNETTGVLVHLFALSAQILALLQLGRFGDALRVIGASQELAQKNGSDRWLFLYRETWLRTLAMDFTGVCRVCQTLGHSSVYPTGQAKTIGELAAGFQALAEGADDRALQCFDAVRDRAQTPKFFMHWYWRVHAHLGSTRAWLHAGNLAQARSEVGQLRRAALATADPNLHVLAWEATAQVAIAEMHWADAEESVANALRELARSPVPISAWRVHATAADLYRKTGRIDAASVHHVRALEHLATLVNSFEPDEPIRQALVVAASVPISATT
jgi:DNA-binding winged helix-turn-helix (wHTH) protein/tetratricopeptide (TPR) repeat protein